GVSGTGGGFKRFVTGETDISGASRPMKQSEVDAAAANGIEYVQMVVAIDGLTVVVHPDNQFADCLTIEELRRIWEPFANEATQVRNELGNWSQVRPGFPDQQLRLYGADTDSGTFDYFTEVVVGEAQSSRSDYTASADDNVLVLGIAGDKNSLGYFGYAYYAENSNQLKAVAVDAGEGCVEPNPKNIESGAYSPLSRPLFIYLNLASADRPEVREFLKFYMAEAGRLSTEVGYVPVATAAYAENLALVGIE
ncbi:MAG: PstS family phosphate ABC transporter substrate-binding protein, partial [Chloroflexi bacterium]|nr:PstS family phosphate ABC transporter substrate-binding protein [Chloroflexota bacterium]